MTWYDLKNKQTTESLNTLEEELKETNFNIIKHII